MWGVDPLAYHDIDPRVRAMVGYTLGELPDSAPLCMAFVLELVLTGHNAFGQC